MDAEEHVKNVIPNIKKNIIKKIKKAIVDGKIDIF